MQIRSGCAFHFLYVLVSMQQCKIQMSVQSHSVSVIETVGGGVKVTCFKYRECQDNMPGLTYKSHLHNVSLLPFIFLFSSFFSTWETSKAHVS